LYVSAVKDMNHDKESFYQVEFTILHKKLEVCAFLDTGNFLYEPVSQMPVCILEEETFLKYFHEPLFKMIKKQEAEGIRMIPYQSVGREHGMMPAVMANDMKITKEDRIMEHKKAVIAISKVSLSKWGAYEMLLHPDLIKNGR
jgi:stage II sporulation protein GA (sporulation sigma-E factor processing peptidase)